MFDSNGLASVTLNGKYGYINEAGETVIQPQFEETWSFQIIFRSKVKHAKQIQEIVAQKKKRIAEEEAMQQARIAEEKAMQQARIAEEKAKQQARIAEEKAKQQARWRADGVCQYCGGRLKGLFSKKCANCGMQEDY